MIIYRKRWSKDDEKYKNIGALGYRPEVIDNEIASVSIRGKTGDLYIINPDFFHEIKPVAGNRRRITLGTFIAFDPAGGDIVAWS